MKKKTEKEYTISEQQVKHLRTRDSRQSKTRQSSTKRTRIAGTIRRCWSSERDARGASIWIDIGHWTGTSRLMQTGRRAGMLGLLGYVHHIIHIVPSGQSNACGAEQNGLPLPLHPRCTTHRGWGILAARPKSPTTAERAPESQRRIRTF